MDFSEIMKQASKIQDQMKSAKEELKNIETEGTSGGGLVKVTINGDHELKKIDIDSSPVRPSVFLVSPPVNSKGITPIPTRLER